VRQRARAGTQQLGGVRGHLAAAFDLVGMQRARSLDRRFGE
jgi:hypothetical protein